LVVSANTDVRADDKNSEVNVSLIESMTTALPSKFFLVQRRVIGALLDAAHPPPPRRHKRLKNKNVDATRFPLAVSE